MEIQKGKQSILFPNPVYMKSRACIVGQKEGEGPLHSHFDQIISDPFFGMNTWEEGESKFLKTTCELAISKADLIKDEIRYAFAGDLLGQLIATSFGLLSLEIPLFGLYGACSNIGSALALGSVMVSAGYADHVLCAASSHLGSAEKQFRFPLEYGTQKPLSATWTVTGSGAFVLSNQKGPFKITGITIGKIIDFGIKDAQNMGAAMAPAAADVIASCLKDFSMTPDDFDCIFTGDLGKIGSQILIKLLQDKHYNISRQHNDCGKLIFDAGTQDTHSGGSGCACSASVLAGYILNCMSKEQWKRILFVPTGALFSTVSFNEGKSIPGIAHAIIIESV